jgi:hypothetical protein
MTWFFDTLKHTKEKQGVPASMFMLGAAIFHVRLGDIHVFQLYKVGSDRLEPQPPAPHLLFQMAETPKLAVHIKPDLL